MEKKMHTKYKNYKVVDFHLVSLRACLISGCRCFKLPFLSGFPWVTFADRCEARCVQYCHVLLEQITPMILQKTSSIFNSSRDSSTLWPAQLSLSLALSPPPPPPPTPTCEHESCPLGRVSELFSSRCRVTHLAERRGAALGDLGLQHADQLAQLHAVVQLLHEKLCSHLLPWKNRRRAQRKLYNIDWKHTL